MVTDNQTQSICPECMKVIDAERVTRDGNVYLEKTCPEHGKYSTIIWRGNTPSYEEWNSPDEPNLLPEHQTEVNQGCPLDCGLCLEHRALTCTVLLEVTERCNLGCPVCFARSKAETRADISIHEIERILTGIIQSGGPYPIQLSGGEPTVREDLPEIVALAKRMGFPHVQVNTNGLRLADEIEYLERLKEAGTDLVYLQLDGVSDEVYRVIRGRELAQKKRKAIENCAEIKIGVQLVPTVIRGVNDGELGDIIQLAKEFIPTVKGVHIQPVSYFGRYSPSPSNETRQTLPDVLHSLETQTGGEIAVEHFLPRHKHDAHCGFSAFYILGENGRLNTTTHYEQTRTTIRRGEKTPAEHVREFVINRSRYIEDDPDECECMRAARMAKALARARQYSLSISGMPFMDAWTLDLERLRNCCVHVARTDGRLIPFCANYITNTDGCHLPGIDGVPEKESTHGGE